MQHGFASWAVTNWHHNRTIELRHNRGIPGGNPYGCRYFLYIADGGSVSTNFNDEWWQWRRSKDDRDHKQDNALHRLDLEVAVIKTRQQIISDNAEASRSKTPALVFGAISAVVTLIVLVMQILAWRGGG